MEKLLEKLGQFIGRLLVVSLFYLSYKLVGFESIVVILLAGIFVSVQKQE